MRTLFTLFLALVASVTHFAIAVAQSEILIREIRVVDQDGKPIQDAVADSWLINEKYF